MIYKVTRSDDFLFRKGNKRREPIVEEYCFDFQIDERDGEVYVLVEYSDLASCLFCSCQPFMGLKNVFHLAGRLGEFLQVELKIDREYEKIDILNGGLVKKKLSSLKEYSFDLGLSENELLKVDSDINYLLENFGSYLKRDVEIVAFPPTVYVELGNGFYSTTGLFNANAVKVHKTESSIEVEVLKAAKSLTAFADPSLKRMIKEFESNMLRLDECPHKHIMFNKWKFDRESGITDAYLRVGRTNTKLIEKQTIVKIEKGEGGWGVDVE